MAKAKILIVEDESIVARDLQQRLMHLDYDVVGAVPTGEEAIKKASILLPDVVLMDVRLKGEMDGIEAATEIRFRFGIPSIYLSAYADNDTLKRASVTEPFGYILKPFEERELHTTIEMALYRYDLERKIKESETWYGTTLRSLGEAVIATDTNGLIKFMNATAESLTGWRLNEAQGQDLMKVFQTMDAQTKVKAMNPVEQILRNKITAVLKNHATLISRDGKEVPIDESASPIKDERGSTVGVVLVFQDVSERKRAQEALRASQEYSLNIINSSMDMIIAVDLDRKMIEYNNAAEETFGYKKEEVLGKHINMLYADKDSGSVVNKTVDEQGQGVMEVFNRRKNGEVFPCLLSSSVLRNARGEKIGFMGVSRDITDLKKAEATLKTAQEYAQNIINSSLDMIIAVDKDRRIVEFNRAAEETFGYLAKEVLGKHINILYADPEEGSQVHDTTILNGRYIKEITNLRKNGETFPSLLSASVLKNSEGRTIGVMGVSRDITEIKRSQESLKENEERYRAIVELMPDPIAVHIDGKIIFVNSAAVKTFAAESPDELIGKEVMEVIHPDSRITVSERVRLMQNNARVPVIEEKFIRLDGTIFEAEVSAVPFLWHGKTAIQVIMRDLSERKRADQAIRASETKYRTLFENVLDGVYQTTPEGEILTTNPAFAQMLGYESEAELLLINVEDIYANKENRKEFLDVLEKEGRIFNAELSLKRKDGGVITVLENARVVRNKYGEILFFEGTIRDITELKMAQGALKKSEERFKAFAGHSTEAIWALECRQPIDTAVPNEEAMKQFIEGAYISECNDVLAHDHGYKTSREMIGTALKKLLNHSDVFTLSVVHSIVTSCFQVENLETHELDKEGHDRYFLNNVVGIYDGGKIVRVWGSQLDITEQKRNKMMSSIAYRIALATDSSRSTEELFKEVHGILQDVMPAKNFYVALLDGEKDIHIQYFADELNTQDQVEKAKKNAMEFLFSKGQSLLITPDLSTTYEQNGDIVFSSVQSRMWLGVPLKLGDKIIGALVLQNYSNTPKYNHSQRIVLEFIAAQIAKTIDYKRSFDILKEKELWFEQFFKENTVPSFISDKDGNVLEYNQSFENIMMADGKTNAGERKCGELFASAKDRKKFLGHLEQAKRLEKYEIEIPCLQNKFKKAKINAVGRFDQDGRVMQIQGSLCV